MKHRLHPGLLLVLVIVVCTGLLAALAFVRSLYTDTAAELLAHLPAADSVVLSIDFRALRQSGVLGMLAGSKVSEEPEYQTFVLETGFDYRQDLDSAIVSFHRGTVYALLRGRFDWRKLRAYVQGQHGVCRNTFCRMQGSTPERMISFFPLRLDLMALAVSGDDWAAANLMSRKPLEEETALPRQPVWLVVPASSLQDDSNLPAGTRLFAKAMQGAERIVLSLGARGDRFEALLEVTCRSEEDASVLLTQLEGITRLLKEMIARENKTPNPRDLSGVLTAGTFRRADQRVLGRWPLERAFLQSLAGGSL